MKFKLSIIAKVGLTLGFIFAMVITNIILTNITLSKNKEYSDQIANVYNPSRLYLEKMRDMVNNSHKLTLSWVYIEQQENTPNKQALQNIHKVQLPALNDSILTLTPYWEEEMRVLYEDIYYIVKDSLFAAQKEVMNNLASFEDYNDAFKKMMVEDQVSEYGNVSIYANKALEKLDVIIDKQAEIVSETQEDSNKSFSNLRKTVVIMGLFLILATLAAMAVIMAMIRPVNTIKNLLLQMAKGILPDKGIKEGEDEIGQMASALNKMVSGLKNISNFAVQVGKGNLESDFEPLSSEDILGNSLLEMREELKKAAEEEEKRKIEDDHRNWATQGLAKFAEILRKDNDNLEVLSFNIISELVKYNSANQGGLFLINDDDKDNVVLELKGCYAYDRQKFMNKNIPIGVGLVGRCVQEKETIFLTDVPGDYINITSGLGKDTPRSLILVPLILNEVVFGVIEMASFKVFEPYQIEFLERIGETIASTISTVKINVQTALLLEQSQQQTEEMASQEEEMRQNMEELQATQEESARREKELLQELENIKSRMKQAGITV